MAAMKEPEIIVVVIFIRIVLCPFSSINPPKNGFYRAVGIKEMPSFESINDINILYWLLVFGIFSDNLMQLAISFSVNPTKIEKTPAKNTSVIKCNSQKICTCPLEPITARYPDPTDRTCEQFYLCHLGFAFKKKCDVRKAFHSGTGECLARSQVSLIDCPPPISCATNGFTADPHDCTKYYMCFYMQAYHYACKAKHYYDTDKNKCTLNQTQTEICSREKPSTTPASSLLANEIDIIQE